jgi:hypothetical protein
MPVANADTADATLAQRFSEGQYAFSLFGYIAESAAVAVAGCGSGALCAERPGPPGIAAPPRSHVMPWRRKLHGMPAMG